MGSAGGSPGGGCKGGGADGGWQSSAVTLAPLGEKADQTSETADSGSALTAGLNA
jgi:hypothetical protein